MIRSPRSLIRTVATGACLWLTAGLSASENPTIWPNLETGPYAVGYTVKHEYDHSRTFRRPHDFAGNKVKGPISRPIQISIWYPAKPGSDRPTMKYEEYYLTKLTETDYSPSTDAQTGAFLEDTRRVLMMEWGIPPERRDTVARKLADFFEHSTRVFKNARPADRRFPLILHMSGYNASPVHHISLFEYLASHGYVVAALPSMGMYSGSIDDELLSLEVQARDMEFVCDYMSRQSYVDPERIGTTGMSWGGMSNVLFGQRNYRVDAVVTLDGAITMVEELKLIESIPGFDVRTFYPAYLQLLVEPTQAVFRPKNLAFFDGLLYSDAHSVQFNTVVHDDFACDHVRLINLSETDRAKAAFRERFLRTLHQSVLCFFDAHLKDNDCSRAFFESEMPGADSLADLVASVTSKAAARIPPTRKEFVAMIESGDVERAGRVYLDAKAVDSLVDLSLASYVMGPLFMQAFQGKRYGDALDICRLWLSGDSTQAGPYFSMARVFRQTDRKAEAIACYEKILEITDNDRQVQSANRALDELRR